MSFNFLPIDQEFQDAIAYLKQEYLQISTGRANPSLLDSLYIESYGSRQPIKNIASITVEDARSMKVSPWDRSHIQKIEKAIHESGMPFSLASDESGVRVHIPQLTEETRKSLVKILKDKLEDSRIKIRGIRQETIKQIDEAEKAGEFAEDAKNRYKDELQKKVDTTNDQLQSLFEAKEIDVMKV